MRHIESSIQQSCVRWFRYQYPELQGLLFAVPNGGYRDEREASRFKKEGVVSGVSDLILLVPKNGFSALCVELKAAKGRLTDKQKEWQEKAGNAGNKCVVVRSVDEFIHEVNSYLK